MNADDILEIEESIVRGIPVESLALEFQVSLRDVCCVAARMKRYFRSDFKTWEAARAFAEIRVADTGIAHGIEKNTALPGPASWIVKMLPRPENRFGWELRCEAIEPSAPLPYAVAEEVSL